MQASKKVPFENPMVLNGVRALYVVSNLIIVGVYLYVQSLINKKKGMAIQATHAIISNDSTRHDRAQVC